jgi:hypothetical protein
MHSTYYSPLVVNKTRRSENAHVDDRDGCLERPREVRLRESGGRQVQSSWLLRPCQPFALRPLGRLQHLLQLQSVRL